MREKLVNTDGEPWKPGEGFSTVGFCKKLAWNIIDAQHVSIQYIYESFLVGVLVIKCCFGKINMISVHMMDYKEEKSGNEAILLVYYSDKLASVK